MKLFGVVFTVFGLAHVAFTSPSGAGTAGNPGGMNMGNFNLNTAQGIQGFLNMEGINPSQLVTSNCIANGNPCSTTAMKQCCLSPVFSCQGTQGNSVCRVVPGHVNHIPQIQQIVATIGASTTNPIF